MNEPTQIKAIETRISEIMKAIEQSAANHNGLLGRLSEAQHILSIATAATEAVVSVVDAVEAIS